MRREDWGRTTGGRPKARLRPVAVGPQKGSYGERGLRKALGKVAAGEPVAIIREVFESPLTDPDSGRKGGS
jgi:hypothetical protein